MMFYKHTARSKKMSHTHIIHRTTVSFDDDTHLQGYQLDNFMQCHDIFLYRVALIFH